MSVTPTSPNHPQVEYAPLVDPLPLAPEAVLVDLGVPMGPVIASIHEMRDELRDQIMQEGELEERPKLKSASLRDRVEPDPSPNTG